MPPGRNSAQALAAASGPSLASPASTMTMSESASGGRRSTQPAPLLAVQSFGRVKATPKGVVWGVSAAAGATGAGAGPAGAGAGWAAAAPESARPNATVV